MKKLLMCSVGLLALTACGVEEQNSAKAPSTETEIEAAPPEAKGPELGTWGVDTKDIDDSINPGDDFFTYVNGKWLDSFEIPAEFSNYGSFTVLFERSEERVKSIIEEAAAKTAPAGSVEQKIGDFYATFLDIDTINEKGLDVAKADLDRIAAIETHEDVAAAMVDPMLSTRSIIGGWVDVDSRQTDQYIFYVGQSGLGMPNRDYYLKENFAAQRIAYKKFLSEMMARAGIQNTQERAEAVFDVESKIAEIHWEPAKRRQRELTYNKYAIEELPSYAPGFPWAAAMQAAGLGGEKAFILRENDAIQKLAAMFTDVPVGVWTDYLTVHYLSSYASVLPTEFDETRYAFYGKALSGTEKQRERWKRGVAAVNGSIGEAVGQIYVDKFFPAQSKEMMDTLVKNLRTTFAQRLDNLDWMSAETKEEARSKLTAFTTKIGYPDKWTDYSSLRIVSGDAFGNAKRTNAWKWEDMISKLGGPIDRTEWFMTPQTVNAYYSPNRNEIVFPAAILQAPFFDPLADAAVNYGGIGAVIGHEIGHGFDDQGRKSDGSGTLRDWWTQEDADRFQIKADALGTQYGAYSPIDGMFVDPELTMGENIGDLGGLTMAYNAYKLSLNGEEAPIIDGLTGDQRFFLAWGQVWKRKYREAELQRRLTTDSHSPSQYRVNGIVRNMDEWYEAFDITEEDALYLPPEERVRIW